MTRFPAKSEGKQRRLRPSLLLALDTVEQQRNGGTVTVNIMELGRQAS